MLEFELPWLEGIIQACTPQRLPVVMTRAEAQAVLARMRGTHKLVPGLLYGAGLRLMEVVRLRVKDVEFIHCEILIREGKGG